MKNKKLHIEALRIVAIILVLLNHSDLFYTFYTNTDNGLTFGASTVISAICKINVPLFMMITGAMLLEKEESWKEIIQKRVLKIVFILLVFSFILYLLKSLVWGTYSFSIADFGTRILKKDIQVSYWYLYEYISILLVLPFIKKMVKGMDKSEFGYFFGLGVVGLVLCNILACFTGVSLPVSVFIHLDSVLYVVLGYYLEHKLREEWYRKQKCKILMGCILGTVVLVVVAICINYAMTGVYSQAVVTLLTPLQTVLVYILLKRFFMDRKISPKGAMIITWLGGCTFGIYLLEYVGQKLFLPLYLGLCEKTFGVLACGIYVSCIYLFSVLLVSVLKKVPYMQKWI